MSKNDRNYVNLGPVPVSTDESIYQATDQALTQPVITQDPASQYAAQIGTVVSYDTGDKTAIVTVGTEDYIVSNFTGTELAAYYLVALNSLIDGSLVAVGHQVGYAPLPDFGIPFTYNGHTYRAAPKGWDSGNLNLDATVVPWAPAGMVDTSVVTTSGTGALNTNNIISTYGGDTTTYAAGICSDYAGGGYTDWYLPSLLELDAMMTELAPDTVTGEANGFWVGSSGTTRFAFDYSPFYWTSEQYTDSLAKVLAINGTIDNRLKAGTQGFPYSSCTGAIVRPIRLWA